MYCKLRNNTEQQPPFFPGQLAGHHSQHQTWTDSVHTKSDQLWTAISFWDWRQLFQILRLVSSEAYKFIRVNKYKYVACVSLWASCQYTNDQYGWSSWPGWARVSPHHFILMHSPLKPNSHRILSTTDHTHTNIFMSCTYCGDHSSLP